MKLLLGVELANTSIYFFISWCVQVVTSISVSLLSKSEGHQYRALNAKDIGACDRNLAR